MHRRPMTTEVFERAIVTGAKMLGGKMDVVVQFEGNEACTDGNVIFLPAIYGHELYLTDEEISFSRGYYHHECAHIMFTPRSLHEKIRDIRIDKDELYATLLNIVEDCRIEKLWLAEYEGSLQFLSDVHDRIDMDTFSAIVATQVTATDDEDAVLNGNSYVRMPISYMGPQSMTWFSGQAKGYAGKWSQHCWKSFKPDQLDHLREYYSWIEAVETPEEAISVAQQIADAMREYDKDGMAPCQIKVRTQAKEWEDMHDDRLLADGDAEPVIDITKPFNIEAKAYMEQITRHDHEQAPHFHGNRGDAIYRPYTTAGDRVFSPGDWQGLGGGELKWSLYGATTPSEQMFGKDALKNGLKHYVELSKMVGGKISVMRRKIQRGFVAQITRRWDSGHMDGRLDPGRLVRAFNLHPDVFRKRQRTPEIDTDVQILIDGSSSMRGERMKSAMAMGYALSKTMEGIGVGNEALLFLGGNWNSQEVRELEAKEQGFSRYYPLQVLAVKPFDMRVAKCLPFFGTGTTLSHADTPLTDALYLTYPRLEKRHADRKIIILVTDGQPNSQDTARQAIRTMQKKGIEVVAVGIGDDYIGRWCDRSVVVEDVDVLASKVMDDFAKMLLGENFVASNERRVA